MALQRNMGPTRRVLYVLLGAAAVVFALFTSRLGTTEATIIGVLGALTVVSGAVGF